MVVMSQRRSEVVAYSYLAFTTYFCAKNVLIIGFHPTVKRDVSLSPEVLWAFNRRVG